MMVKQSDNPGRGKATQAVVEKARELLGINRLSRMELRLIPYVQYCLVNDRRLDPARLNQYERTILSSWRRRGWIEGGASRDSLRVSKEFWDAMSELMWLAYANWDETGLPASEEVDNERCP